MKIPCGERLCFIVGEKFNALVLEGGMDFKKIELGEVEVIFLGERKRVKGGSSSIYHFYPYSQYIAATISEG